LIVWLNIYITNAAKAIGQRGNALVKSSMKQIPDINKYERLVLRCYLKNIVTVSSLSDRLITIMDRLDKKQINSLAFSVTS
jgi:hypothetical protein